MQRLTWILAACLGLAVSTTAWAGDSHSKSGGLLGMLNSLFHSSDSASSTSSEQADADAATGTDIDTTGQTRKKSKFIYLDDGSSDTDDEAMASASIRLRATPPVAESKDILTPSLLFELGHNGRNGHWSDYQTPFNSLYSLASPLGFVTTREGGLRLGLTFPGHDGNDILSDLNISITSRMLFQSPDLPGSVIGHGPENMSADMLGIDFRKGLERRVYSLGMTVDYNGFFLGAEYGRQQDSLLLGYRGYDLGIGYHGRSWSTGIKFSGYRKDGDLLGLNGDPLGAQNIRAIQVGAAYSWGPWITFSGQFRYYDYNNRTVPDLLLEDSRVFTLGTSLNF